MHWFLRLLSTTKARITSAFPTTTTTTRVIIRMARITIVYPGNGATSEVTVVMLALEELNPEKQVTIVKANAFGKPATGLSSSWALLLVITMTGKFSSPQVCVNFSAHPQ